MTKIFPHCTISVGLAPLADYLYMRAMGRHGFPGIPRKHAAAFSCNGSARGICADAYI